MILYIISYIIMSIFSGIFYRMGGSKYYHTAYRDILCSLLIAGNILFFNTLKNNWYWGLIVFGIASLSASLSSYFKDKNQQAKWWLVGFMYGLSAIWFIPITTKFIGFITRCLVLSWWVNYWATHRPHKLKLFGHYWDGCQIEEFGKGLALYLTVPLLYI